MTRPEDIVLTILRRPLYMRTHHRQPSALAQSFISALQSTRMLHRPRPYLANANTEVDYHYCSHLLSLQETWMFLMHCAGHWPTTAGPM